jgi:hypothetical protein
MDSIRDRPGAGKTDNWPKLLPDTTEVRNEPGSFTKAWEFIQETANELVDGDHE